MKRRRLQMVMYVIHLPLRDNKGKSIKRKEFARVQRELIDRFGGCTIYPQPVKGFWVHQGIIFEDEVVVFEVWVPRTRENLKWLSRYREILRKRFKQKVIGAKIIPFQIPE